jgi:hypothetical protein
MRGSLYPPVSLSPSKLSMMNLIGTLLIDFLIAVAVIIAVAETLTMLYLILVALYDMIRDR